MLIRFSQVSSSPPLGSNITHFPSYEAAYARHPFVHPCPHQALPLTPHGSHGLVDPRSEGCWPIPRAAEAVDGGGKEAHEAQGAAGHMQQ